LRILVVLSFAIILSFHSCRSSLTPGIFNLAVKNLRGLYYYWLVMYWAFPAIILLSIIYFIIRREDRSKRAYMEAQRSKH